MKPQNYNNHRQIRPVFHYFLFSLVLAILIGGTINLAKSTDTYSFYSAALILAIGVVLFFMFFFMRIFALKAQDRAVRAEENLRHFALTGKLLNPRLTIGQVIALRFAPDDEFVPLAKKAAEENLSTKDIKQAIKNWKADHHRV